MATPICSFAAAALRSADAMSGPPFEERRRHLRGHVGWRGVSGDEANGEGRRRFADQHGDRVFVLRACDAVVDSRRLCRLQLRLRLDHVRAGGRALRVLVLRELQRALIGGDGVVEELLVASSERNGK